MLNTPQKLRVAARKYHKGSYELTLPSGDIFRGNCTFLIDGRELLFTQCNAPAREFDMLGCPYDRGCAYKHNSRCKNKFVGPEVCRVPVKLIQDGLVEANDDATVITITGEGATIVDAKTVEQ